MQSLTHTPLWWILAQGDGPGFGSLLPLIAIMGVMFYFMIIMPQRREQNKVRDMLANMKKNDRVVTAGGIWGIVVNVQQDSPYVTIKVDESSNTRLRVMRTSISRVITEGDEEEVGNKKDLG